jgi:hypothetical protein
MSIGGRADRHGLDVVALQHLVDVDGGNAELRRHHLGGLRQRVGHSDQRRTGHIMGQNVGVHAADAAHTEHGDAQRSGCAHQPTR